jgi:hypothetical protein
MYVFVVYSAYRILARGVISLPNKVLCKFSLFHVALAKILAKAP